MAVSESSRLHASLKKENVPVKRLIVNQILPPSASDCKFCAMKRKVLISLVDLIIFYLTVTYSELWFKKKKVETIFYDLFQDQMRALDMIRSDQELSNLTLIQAPLVDVEIRGVPALRFLGDMIWK